MVRTSLRTKMDEEDAIVLGRVIRDSIMKELAIHKPLSEENAIVLSKAIKDSVIKEMSFNDVRGLDGRIEEVLTKSLDANVGKKLDSMASFYEERTENSMKTKLLEMEQTFQKGFESLTRDRDASVAVVSDMLRKEVSSNIETFTKSHDLKLEEMKSLVNESIGSAIKALEKTYEAKLYECHQVHEKQLEEVKSAYQERVAQMESVYAKSFQTAMSGLKNLVPAVQVMPGAVQVEMKSAHLIMDKALEATVIVPDKSINVQVESKAIFDKPLKTTKSILYDNQTGRPSKIVESTE